MQFVNNTNITNLYLKKKKKNEKTKTNRTARK